MGDMATGVYIIANLVNGKLYVGSSATDLEKRRLRHQNELKRGTHHCAPLQHAFNKYGAAAFLFALVEEVAPSDAIRVEQRYLDEWEPEYNIARVAGSRLGVKISDQTRSRQVAAFATDEQQRIRSEAAKASWARPESREKRLAGLLAAARSEDVQARRSGGIREALATPEARARKRAAATEVNARPEVKQRIKEESLRRWQDPEYVATRQAAVDRPDVRARMSALARERFQDPEYHARMVAMQRSRAKVDEQKAREIRAALQTETQAVVAERYGISKSLVSLIKLNKRWPA